MAKEKRGEVVDMHTEIPVFDYAQLASPDPLDELYPPSPAPNEEIPVIPEPPGIIRTWDPGRTVGSILTPTRREKSPMNEEYMKQMTSMMVMANLYNSSTGRNAKQAAQTAMDAANNLWEVWCENKPCAVRK